MGNYLRKAMVTVALAVLPMLYGCSTAQKVHKAPEPAIERPAAPKIQEPKYTEQDFAQKFNTVLGSTFTARELNTYGACFDKVKSKIDWTGNPDISIKIIKDKTIKEKSHAKEILDAYKKFNAFLEKGHNYLNNCMSNLEASLNEQGIGVKLEKNGNKFSFDKKDINIMHSLSRSMLAYTVRPKGESQYTIAFNPLEDFVRRYPKEDVCETVSHELAGHVLVLGLRDRKDFKTDSYSTDVLTHFRNIGFDIRRLKKEDPLFGFVSAYANNAGYLRSKVDKLLKLIGRAVDHIKSNSDRIRPVFHKLSKEDIKSKFSEEDIRCIAVNSSYVKSFGREIFRAAEVAKKTNLESFRHSSTMVEDVAETASFLIPLSPVLDKDEFTRKKAHTLKRFFEIHYGTRNVHIDLPFPEPEGFRRRRFRSSGYPRKR